MCGIVGWIGKGAPFKNKEFDSALQDLKHRGPNHRDFVLVDNKVFLGHSRLSIIDLESRSNQPMKSNCGRYWIVYNGECFNYSALREELSKQGAVFQTSSDTEVLLQGLILEGEGFIKRVNGFFAFAFYDTVTEEILLGRDRLGIKPLYIHLSSDGLRFSSELRPLKRLGVPFSINHRALNEYLLYSYVPEPLCLVSDVVKLAPGTILHYTPKGEATQTRYYNLSQPGPQIELSFAEAATKCKEKIEHAVGLRMVADVPVGSFLSGGIDSSIIASIAQKLHGGIQTYSVGFEGRNFFDETNVASRTAIALGTKHENIVLSDEKIFNHIDLFFDAMDEPFADSSAINVFLLCKCVKEHITVALSGDGADEVFGGYNKHRALRMSLNPFYRSLLSAIRPLLNTGSSSRGSMLKNKARQLHRLSIGMGKSTRARYAYWAAFSNPNDVHRTLVNPYQGNPSFYDLLPKKIECLNDFLYADQNIILPSDMLTKVDKMSMASSLEVRVPFLDHHVVDLANSLPSSFKIKGSTTKRLLRKGFKNDLPSEVFLRPKHGFEVPLEEWTKTVFSDRIEQFIQKDFLDAQGLFLYKPLRQIFESNQKEGGAETSAFLYSFLVFQEWWARINLIDG
ncbi:MAG: asparagine synthase (glutamine-hydrolyzing) [Bacteroidetes bacterium]|nr:MAG: asparagine synthase (glutamine-hydrolyzing) [Bacteroidota bacterium]